MIDILEFIEQLKDIRGLILTSSEECTNKYVLKYIDTIIDLHQKKIDKFEKDMREEYNVASNK